MTGRPGVAIGEQDVSPPAELGKQAGSGLVDAEEVQRHPARWRPCVRGPAESVLSPAVLDHNHAEAIVSEHTIKPAVGQIQGCEQRRLGHTPTVELVQQLQGERRHAVQRGKYMDRTPSTDASTRPCRPHTRRWPALPAAPFQTSRDPDRCCRERGVRSSVPRGARAAGVVKDAPDLMAMTLGLLQGSRRKHGRTQPVGRRAQGRGSGELKMACRMRQAGDADATHLRTSERR